MIVLKAEATLENSLAVSQKVRYKTIIWPSKNLQTKAALFMIVPSWRQIKCPLSCE